MGFMNICQNEINYKYNKHGNILQVNSLASNEWNDGEHKREWG